MRSKRTKQFRAQLEALPETIQNEARQAYQHFKDDPSYPGLHFEQIKKGKNIYYSARAGIHYRALAIRRPDYWLWFWIGSHAEYDKLLS